MNPRRFCREPSYPKALLLTYSFDPVFFERLVLPDLRVGNASDILVIGDRQQIDAAITAAAGQIWHLGKRYLLAGANHAGSFHPKVVLRLGTQDGAILLGSGNLTSAGWGGNQELGTAWMFGPKYADKGAWLHAFLDQVMAWCGGELERDAVQRMKEVPWLSRTPVNAAGSNPVLHSQPDQALGPALAKRWRGRRFDEVKILTGSTDESGAFLRWAHATFGIQRAIVALTPARTSFLPEKLKDLPVDLRLIAAPADRPLHAKLYWFDGPMGPGAVMGSANCSAAAWRLPPNRGGNVETVVVYDAPRAEEFESALALFGAPSQAPADLLPSSPSIRTYQPPPIQREYELISLSWDLTTCCVRAGLRPPPPDDSTVELILDGQRLPMRHPRSPGGCWECELPEGIGSATVFASVRLYRGTQIWDTQLRWVDDLAALQQTSQSARLLAPFEGLERSDSSAEQNQVLNELQEIAQVLFADAASFRDPAFGLGRQEPTAHETPPAPVNPNDLVCHLEESPDTLPQVGSSRPGTLPLTGILRLLFDAEPDEGGGTATELIEDLDEEQGLASGGKALAKRKSEKETTHQDLTPIEERLRKRLADQIETFLGNLSSRQFARQ